MRLVHLESVGGRATMEEATAFCGRQFLSLFGGTLLVVFTVLVAVCLLNGLVAAISDLSAVGSLAAILFLPQLLLNLVLVVALLSSVLMPRAIAVEDIGAGPAFGRVFTAIRHHTRELIIEISAIQFLP